MKLRYIIAFMIAVVFIMITTAVFFDKGPGKGDMAPDFVLENLAGKKISLNDYKGQIVLVHFWATWCEICRYELPSVEYLHNMYKDKGLKIISVLAEDIDKMEVEKRLKKLTKITFPLLPDRNSKLADLYGVYGVPESFIIGKDGKILARLTGGIDWDGLSYISYFDKLLK